MKSLAIKLLILFSVLFFNAPSFSADMDPGRWDAYCKNEKEKCGKAEMLCELNPKEMCAEIKMAFIANKPIPAAKAQREKR